MSAINEANLLYFIDQYIDGVFMSRSEPFYEKSVVIQFLEKLQHNSQNDITYKISVSLPLKDYENLVLSTEKIKIKFLEKTPSENTSFQEERKIKAFRYNNGYILYDNKASRDFISRNNLQQYLEKLGNKKLYFILDNTISEFNLNFVNIVNVKSMTTKIMNLLN